VKINPNGEGIEGFALPLLPVVQEEDITQFLANIEKIAEWYEHMKNFLASHRICWNNEQKKWYLA
jgi:hypothetical protein